MAERKFYKFQGTGNDFHIVDSSFFGFNGMRPQDETFNATEREQMAPQIRSLCKRHFGAGSDGCMVVSEVGPSLYKVSVFDINAYFAKMCGNGFRCAAAYISAKKGMGKQFRIATDNEGGYSAVLVQRENATRFWVEISVGVPSNFGVYELEY